MNPLVAELVARLSEEDRELWEERAAIMQYDAGYSRDSAECLAWTFGRSPASCNTTSNIPAVRQPL